MTNQEVRTRFAPSPTGFQHIGGFRTAFFSWLLAKHFGGKFLLRIEDTDQERLVPGSVKFILEEFKWFGIDIDEGPSKEELSKIGESIDGEGCPSGSCGPYIQSLRLPRYKEVAEELVSRGHAYRCDCTAEMLEKERLEQMARKERPGYSGYCRTRNVSPDSKHVIRLKMPHKVQLFLMDAVKGRIDWENPPLRDAVLLKSDGFPTYHLAVVVDDHDMKISHALRGDEWIPSTPLHLLVYQALEWTPPVFGHLPVILGPDGKKLSKRHGATVSSAFREAGYLPEALMNFMVLIGWSPGEGEEQEIFSKEELIKRFTLDHVNKASAVFHYTKLDWMNGVYIRNLSPEEFLKRADPFLAKAGIPYKKDTILELSVHLQERVKHLSELPDMVSFLFADKIDRDLGAMFKKEITKEKAHAILEQSVAALEAVKDFSALPVEEALRTVATSLGLKPGPAFSVIRIAATGKSVTPPLFESLVALGKDRTISRLKEALPLVESWSGAPKAVGESGA